MAGSIEARETWEARKGRGTVFWYRVITWLALNAGRLSAWLLLYPITLYFFLTSPSTRRASQRFLSLALDRPATWRESYRHHRYFACTILDRVYLLGGRHDCLDITIDGAEPIRDLIAQGSSCMILGTHLGSFEVLRTLGVRDKAFQIRVLMRQEHNRTITDFLNRLDPSVANVVIPLGTTDSMLLVREAVERGHLIGLLGDRALSHGKTHTCTFLGKPAEFPVGPMKLAMILEIPIYLFFGIYEGGNRYSIHFELLSNAVAPKRDERDEVAARLTEAFTARLEYRAKQAPYNWFNFYDFWLPS